MLFVGRGSHEQLFYPPEIFTFGGGLAIKSIGGEDRNAVIHPIMHRTVSHTKGTCGVHHVSNVEVRKPSSKCTQCLLILKQPHQSQSHGAKKLKHRKAGFASEKLMLGRGDASNPHPSSSRLARSARAISTAHSRHLQK